MESLDGDFDAEENGLAQGRVLAVHVLVEEAEEVVDDGSDDVGRVEHEIVHAADADEENVREGRGHVLGAEGRDVLLVERSDGVAREADDVAQRVQKVLHAVLLLAGGLFELVTRVFHLTILEIDLLVHGLQDLHGLFQELEEVFHHGGKRVGRNRHALVLEHVMALIAAFIARLRLNASLWGYAENVAERFGDAASLRSGVFGRVLLDQHLHALVVVLQALLRGGLVAAQSVHQQREELGENAGAEVADLLVPGEVDEGRNGSEHIAHVGNEGTK